MTNERIGVSIEELNQHFRNKLHNDSRFEYQDKSLIAKMGFQDSQLKTPEHDKMIDVLMDDIVLSKIANKVMSEKGYETKFKDKSRNYFIVEFNSNDKWTKNEEFVVKGYNNFIIGYIDLVVSSSKTFKHYIDFDKCEKFIITDQSNKVPIEHWKCKECESINSCKVDIAAGYCNNHKLHSPCKKKYITDKIKFCFYNNVKECSEYENICEHTKTIELKLIIEVKTRIDSIGELIRQVNTYRTIINDGHFVVVAPNINDNQRKRLKESDILIVDIKELI